MIDEGIICRLNAVPIAIGRKELSVSICTIHLNATEATIRKERSEISVTIRTIYLNAAKATTRKERSEAHQIRDPPPPNAAWRT